MKSLLKILLVVATISISPCVFATVFIDVDTTWTVAGSPHVISETTVVQRGATLTIESGAEALAAPGVQLIIQGELVVVGDDFAYFGRSQSDSAWAGIKFDRTDQVEVSLLDVTGATRGIHISECYDLAVFRSRIHGNDTGLYLDAPSGVRYIRNRLFDNQIVDNEYAVRLASSGAELRRNLIARNAQGISANGGSCGAGSNCGWRLNAFDNLFTDNSTGISARGFHMSLSANDFRRNGVGATVNLFNNASTAIGENNFETNSSYAVTNGGTLDLNIGFGWFGSRIYGAASEAIFDIYDDFNRGEVLFEVAKGRFATEHHYDRRFLKALPDVDGDNLADVFVLDRPPMDDTAIGALWSSASSTLLSQISFGDEPVVDAQVTSSNGVSEAIALLAHTQGWIEVRAENISTGELTGQAWFDSSLRPRQLFLPMVLAAQAGEPLAVMLGTSDTGQPQAQIKSLTTGNSEGSVSFDPAFGYLSAVIVSDSINTESLAMLGKDALGSYRAEVKQLVTAGSVRLVNFDPSYAPVELVALPDLGNDGSADLAVLGIDASGQSRVQINDIATDTLVSLVYFDQKFHPFGMGFYEQSGRTILSVLGEDDSGVRRVQSKDALTGQSFGFARFSSDSLPYAMSVIDDFDGGGLPKIAVLGYSLDQGVRVQVKGPQTFDDVATDNWAYSFIEVLVANGITAGCGNDNYCPSGPVTRAQMAVFLERGMNGSGYTPPAATGSVFSDIGAGDFAANFIEQLASDGITAGCGNGNYCPDATVTRDQMAVFLLRAKYGSGYSPPTATGVFGDVDLSHWAGPWIEQLAAEGITAGCGNNNYCPTDPVTRDQMAVFLVRAFGL